MGLLLLLLRDSGVGGGSLASNTPSPSNKPTLTLRQGGEGCFSVLCFTFADASFFSFCVYVCIPSFVFLLCFVFLYVFLLFCILSVCVFCSGVTGLQPPSNASPTSSLPMRHLGVRGCKHNMSATGEGGLPGAPKAQQWVSDTHLVNIGQLDQNGPLCGVWNQI